MLPELQSVKLDIEKQFDLVVKRKKVGTIEQLYFGDGNKSFYALDADYLISTLDCPPESRLTQLEKCIIKSTLSLLEIRNLIGGWQKEGKKKILIRQGDIKIVFYHTENKEAYSIVLNHHNKTVKPLHRTDIETKEIVAEITHSDFLAFISYILEREVNESIQIFKNEQQL